jgi:hypothetical protein
MVNKTTELAMRPCRKETGGAIIAVKETSMALAPRLLVRFCLASLLESSAAEIAGDQSTAPDGSGAVVAEHPGHPLLGGIDRSPGHPQGLGGPLDDSRSSAGEC